MRKSIKIGLAIAVVAGVACGAYVLYARSSETKSAAQTMTAEAKTGDLESVVTAQGTLEPKDYVDVGAQVSGLVERLHVDIGDTVQQGDLIAEIDPDVYESRVSASEAELKILQAQKAEQEALVAQAQQKFNRNQKLIKDKAISREVLQDSETSLNVAKAKIESLGAQIEKAQSTLDGDKTNLSYTKIYAPMNGTVVSQSVKEGQTINANQTAPVIVQVANLSTMTVKAQVAEADIAKLSKDMPMYFTTMGSAGRKWNGVIRQILPSPETVNDVVLYNVLVDVGNEDNSLMTGMTTQMFFVLDRVAGAVLLPVAALKKRVPEQDGQGTQAYEITVMEKAGPKPRIVQVRLSDRTQAAIAQGVQAGEKVLLGDVPAAAGRSMTGMARRMGVGRI